jgi:Domain of unknown function (DUF4340)
MTEAKEKPPVVPILRRRLRALASLAVVTGIAVLLASLALWQRAATGVSDFKAVRMFPSLQGAMEDVASIHIETKGASFNVVRDGQKHWILPDKSKYAADFNTVKKTVLGLAELDLVEQRTARADWHDQLGLKLPKSGGSSTVVTLKDGKGEELASLVVGGAVEGASAGGEQAVYVRHPNDPQTYVARGNFAPPTDEAQWLDKTFVELSRDRIKTAAIEPFKGRPYSVTRDKPQDQNFRLAQAVPAGRVLRTESEPNGIGNALLGISFDDVKPASELNFTNAAHASYVTFDGLTLKLGLIEKDSEFWTTVEVVANPAAPKTPPTASAALKPDVEKEAKELNATLGGWAFKIPRYKGTLITAPLDDLLVPAGSGK